MAKSKLHPHITFILCAISAALGDKLEAADAPATGKPGEKAQEKQWASGEEWDMVVRVVRHCKAQDEMTRCRGHYSLG